MPFIYAINIYSVSSTCNILCWMLESHAERKWQGSVLMWLTVLWQMQPSARRTRLQSSICHDRRSTNATVPTAVLGHTHIPKSKCSCIRVNQCLYIRITQDLFKTTKQGPHSRSLEMGHGHLNEFNLYLSSPDDTKVQTSLGTTCLETGK